MKLSIFSVRIHVLSFAIACQNRLHTYLSSVAALPPRRSAASPSIIFASLSTFSHSQTDPLRSDFASDS